MLCPSVTDAKTPWSSFPMQVPTSPNSSVNSGHLLMLICITALFSHKLRPCVVVLFIWQLRGFICEQRPNILSCALFWCASRTCTCLLFFLFFCFFSKKWNIELRSVRVSCCSPAGDFESEVNEYLTDTHEAVSYSEAEQTRLWSAETWCSTLQNISTPKSSRCLLRRGPPPVGSLSVCALNFLM